MRRRQSQLKGVECRRVAVWALAGIAVAVGASRAGAAGLLVADGGFGGVLEIEEHSAEVTINNSVAVTQVTQVFRNTEKRQVEALYTFPVPKGASVSNFSMWINGKEMIGEVVEKKRAREIYESYKRTRRDPGLLEQVDYKTFEMRIFPIGPEARQRVQITYCQELDHDHDWVSYVYPLATVTRRDITDTTTGRFALNLEVKSAIPIAEMASPSHGEEFVIARHTDAYHQASLEARGGRLNRDVVLAYRLTRPRTGLDLVASREGNADGHFCLMLTAGEELAKVVPGMDYVFILDVSGSMQHDGKMRLSRESIGEFVKILGDDDRFELITFNVQPHTLFNRLNETTAETRRRAVDFLASQQARGGTVLNPAITTAYKYADPDRTMNVVILSDGMTEQRERQQLLQLITARPRNTRVFCIGVGNEVNRPLLEQLAEDAGGLAAFVSHGDSFERQAKAFRRKLMRPVASNVRIEIGGVPVHDLEPRKLPNLYHGAPVRLYGRYRGQGPAQVRIRADVGSFAIDKTMELEFPKQQSGNREVERMWAWHRVQRLLKEADRAGSRASVIDEIVQLGEGYSIASEYTSFIVLENDAEYKRWQIARRNAVRVAGDRRAQESLRAQLEALRTKSMAGLGPQPDSPVQDKALALAPAGATRSPQARAPRQNALPAQRPQRQSLDLDIGVGGGGAIDPVTGVVLLLIGGAGLASRIGKRKDEE